MSRAWFPRRIPAGIPAFAVALAVGMAALAAPVAHAQAPSASPRTTSLLGADVYARRCNQAVAEGDVSDRAVEVCARALENPRLEPDAALSLRVNAGITHMRRGEHRLAVADFDTALALSPDSAEALVNRGAALVQLREYGPAIAALTQALGLGVDEPHKAYFNRAVAREALGDLRGAFEDYNTALDIQPDWGPANAELARFARRRQELLAARLDPTRQ